MQSQNKKRKTSTSYKKPYKKRVTYKKKNKGYTIKVDRPYKERKMFTNLYGSSTVSLIGTASAEFIGCPKPGTSFYERIGNNIMYKSLMFKAKIDGPTDLESDRTIRIAIVYDKQPSGVAATLEDIFQDVSITGATQFSGFSGNNITNISRFSIIRDYVRIQSKTIKDGFGIYYNTLATNQQQTKGSKNSDIYIEDYIKLPSLPQTFTKAGATGGIADVQSGAIYVCIFGSQANTPQTVGWTIRARYSDQ